MQPNKQIFKKISKVYVEYLRNFSTYCVINEGSTYFKIAVSHFIISLSLSLCSVAKSCSTLLQLLPGTVVHQASLSVGFSGKNTGVGCNFLLQGIFPDQGLNPGLPHCRQTLTSEPPGKTPVYNGGRLRVLHFNSNISFVFQIWVNRQPHLYLTRGFWPNM